MKKTFHSANIKFSIVSCLLAVGVLVSVTLLFTDARLQISRLTQTYALIAITFLYLSLIVTPFLHVFPHHFLQKRIYSLRKFFGMNAFFFALIHASFAFFGQLGGFSGIAYLSSNYLLAISLAFLSLQILLLLTISSINNIIKKMTLPRWNTLQNLAYIAGVLTLIHALMLGSHFIDLLAIIPQLFFVAFSFLLILEAIRIGHFLSNKYSFPFTISIPVLFALVGLGYLIITIQKSPENNLLYNIHAEHIRLAKEAQQTSLTTQVTSSIPGLTGDKNKRYTVGFFPPATVTPNETVSLTFKVNDASNGNVVTLFNTLYEKKVHMIIVDQSLTYFSHIHPEQTKDGFSISTSFPKDGIYHIYLDFQPFGAIEQQFAFTLPVGETSDLAQPAQQVDASKKKSFDNYTVHLNFPNPLNAKKMSIGEQELIFTITEKESGKQVTYLDPYLSAFGHLVLINQKTFDYIHVHPSSLRPPKANEKGGPTVKFLPLGIYGPIQPGTYRVFAQFNPKGQLFTADFTIKIQ